MITSAKSTFRTFTIVGIVTLSGRVPPDGLSLALFNTATARALFDRQTDDNSIGIKSLRTFGDSADQLPNSESAMIASSCRPSAVTTALCNSAGARGVSNAIRPSAYDWFSVGP